MLNFIQELGTGNIKFLFCFWRISGGSQVGQRPWELILSKLRASIEAKLKIYLYATYAFAVTIIPPSTTKMSLCVGGAIDSIANIPKTAYRLHLGPSPFDSAPRTPPDMHFWVNFPFKLLFPQFNVQNGLAKKKLQLSNGGTLLYIHVSMTALKYMCHSFFKGGFDWAHPDYDDSS